MEEPDPQLAKEYDTIWVRNSFHMVWHLAVAVMLIPRLVLFNHWDYLTLVWFLACMSFVLWALSAHENGRKAWRNGFIVMAAALNPFFPLELRPGTSRQVQVVAALVACASLLVGNKPFPASAKEPEDRDEVKE